VSTQDIQDRWVQNIQRASYADGDGHRVIDTKTIEDMVADIIREGVTAGTSFGTTGPKAARKKRSFRFDTPLLQAKAKARFLKDGLDWQTVSDATGISVGPLKQHLGDTPPKEMGLGVAVSLMAWLGEFDLIAFLLED
jgi:hypothetical protein